MYSGLAVSNISSHALVGRLVSLKLDRDHFVIFGSGPLLAHGIRTDIKDLDIVARGTALDRSFQQGVLTTGALSGAPIAQFWEGKIGISAGWISPEWNADRLIEDCDIFDGFRFAKLEYVLAYKRSLKRPKDVKDIFLIECVLNEAAEYRVVS